MGEEVTQKNCCCDAVIQLITRIFNRIRHLEPNNKPENVVKIMCYVLLHGSDDNDILKLAFTSNSNLISRINDAKVVLGMSSFTNSGPDPFEHSYSLYNQESDSRKRSSSPRTICHYFMKGYCKFGENCRFDHPKNYATDEHRLTTPWWALERLETEIVELLRSRKGRPVSIASLPTLYSAKYGKALHADGYLTESQRRGNVGYSLTTLLSCLRDSIHVIDRPHGQHSVVLAEDAAKYAKCRNERSSETSSATTTTTTTTCSDQIYLTFSAKSKFTVEDVAAYFRQFGPVRDVRIPCQDKRMFGFVCFCNANTVDEILRNRKSHYICGDRVLVKPYRENSRNDERPYMKKRQPENYYPCHQYLHPSVVPRKSYCSPLSQSQLTEKQDEMVELEGSRLSEFHLDSATHLPFVSYNTKPLNEFQWKDNFRYEFEDSNCRLGNDDENAEQALNSCSDQERSQIELPESPFALECKFSTVI